tara:strand:- start:750 stop:1013 length:264 start_codon:yes stop_codon:yes gene_type:complete
MYKGILKVTYFLFIVFFLLFVFIFYFSEDNKNKIKNNRSNYNENIYKQISDLPFLENDTNEVIEYNYDKSEEKKLKKRYFWKLLNGN